MAEPAVSFFEFWPSWLFYAPIVAQWAGFALRYRSVSLPTAANPLITSGGLCGESKRSILDQITGPAREMVARYTSLRTGPAVPADAAAVDDTAVAEAAMEQSGLAYPVVAKPDIGCNGTGVRLVEDRSALARYLAEFPRREVVLLQEFVPFEGEAGLFYIRHPDAAVGRITSVTLKYPPVVVGDGRSTLRRLILDDTRAGRVPEVYLPRLAAHLDDVPPQGERVRLVFVGNHCKGSIFRDGAGHVTPELTAAVERLARALPEFHFGRIDIRFSSPAALARGEGLKVIEINGAGSEATHVWDPRTGLIEAWRAQFFHYAQAWRIGAANRARGYRPTGVSGLWRLWRRQKRLMATYPAND
ncbi:MAG: ATP-grasp domain-containing protein [Rhodospirillales bacterium]|nr:ATP-grasp domain-containing protein [Rhodospirillales bacterium]